MNWENLLKALQDETNGHGEKFFISAFVGFPIFYVVCVYLPQLKVLPIVFYLALILFSVVILRSFSRVSVGAVSAIGLIATLSIDFDKEAAERSQDLRDQRISREYEEVARTIPDDLTVEINGFDGDLTSKDDGKISIRLTNNSEYTIEDLAIKYSVYSQGNRILRKKGYWSELELSPEEQARLRSTIEKETDEFYKMMSAQNPIYKLDGVVILAIRIDGEKVNL